MKPQTIKSLIIVSVGLFLLAAGSSLATDTQPAALAESCIECHGTDGTSPPLIGLPSHYFISAMLAFKTDQRQGSVMNRIAKEYTAREIKVLAKYFEALR